MGDYFSSFFSSLKYTYIPCFPYHSQSSCKSSCSIEADVTLSTQPPLPPDHYAFPGMSLPLGHGLQLHLVLHPSASPWAKEPGPSPMVASSGLVTQSHPCGHLLTPAPPPDAPDPALSPLELTTGISAPQPTTTCGPSDGPRYLPGCLTDTSAPND